jgi:hypothetical protein
MTHRDAPSPECPEAALSVTHYVSPKDPAIFDHPHNARYGAAPDRLARQSEPRRSDTCALAADQSQSLSVTGNA